MKKITRENWIDAAFNALRVKGIYAVKVESIARDLGVTKGGFYRQFAERDDLLQAMLDHWESVLTEEVINKVSKIKGDLSDRFLQLINLVDDNDYVEIEKAMISWSFVDQRTRTIVNRVVRRRLDYMKGLFQEAGFSEEQAELRARLVHSFVNGDRCFPDTCEAQNSFEKQMMLKAFVELACTPHQKLMPKM